MKTERLVGDLSNSDFRVRRRALAKIIRQGGADVFTLIELLESESEFGRIEAAQALGYVGGPEAAGALLRALNTAEGPVRSWAAMALGQTRDAAAFDALVALLADREVRSAAAEGLGRLGDQPAVAVLERELGEHRGDRSPDGLRYRYWLCEALFVLQAINPPLVDTLREIATTDSAAMQDTWQSMRARAVEMLAAIPSVEVAFFRAQLGESCPYISLHAAKALVERHKVDSEVWSVLRKHSKSRHAEIHMPARSLLSSARMMDKSRQRGWTALYIWAVLLAVLAGCPAFISLAVALSSTIWNGFDYPLKLDWRGAMIETDEGVFIASELYGHVYQFGYGGELIDRFYGFDIPSELWWRDGSIVVEHGGREQELARASRDGVARSDVSAVMCEDNWTAPILVVYHNGNVAGKVSMQPWYWTAVQSPYPAILWFALTAGLVALARCAGERTEYRFFRRRRVEIGRKSGIVRHVLCYGLAAALAFTWSQAPGLWTACFIVVILFPALFGLLLGKYAFGCALCFLTAYAITADYWLGLMNVSDGEDFWSSAREQPALFVAMHLVTIGSSVITYLIQRALRQARMMHESAVVGPTYWRNWEG